MAKLTSLTDDQKAQMAPWADAWIARALDPTPADEALVELGMKECYEAAGLVWHGNIVWVDSPLTVAFAGPQAALALELVRGGSAVHSAVYSAVDSAVSSAVYSAVSSAVGSAVGSAVASAVDSAVDSAVGSAVYSAVDSAVDSAVRSAVRSAVDSAVRSAVHSAVASAVVSAVCSAVYSAVGSAVDSAVCSAVRRGWGYYLGGWGWAYWHAYASYYRDVVGLELGDGLWDRSRSYEAAQGAGWWWPHKEFVIVARRHTSIKRDNQGRLHSTTGPAISWGDEFAIYAIDGIRVPEWVVTAPDPARIISDELPNTEQRRVAMAHYGWDRAVHDLNLEIIEASDNPVWGTLYALPETLVERGRATLLVCQNASPDRDGTVRTYGLLASGDARTVVAAQASLARLSEAEWLTLEGAS